MDFGTPICSIDCYPTLLDVAGVESNQATDGVSLLPVLHDPQHQYDRDLFWHYPHYHAGGDSPYSAVRHGDWRLIEFHEDQRQELYNLRTDVGEQKNLVESHTAEAEDLYQRLVAWRKAVDAQMPTLNPEFDPARASQVRRK